MPHPLKKFEIQKNYQNEPKVNGVYSRNNSPKIKYGSYVINLDDYESIGSHSIALHVNGNNGRASYDAIYFYNVRVENIPKEIKKFIGNKNIFTIQVCNSIICEYFCIGFIDFMLTDTSLLDYTKLFSPSYYEKNDKIILRYFQ